MAYIPQVWVDDVTEIDEVHMRHIEEGIENAYNVSLIAISDTAPSECSTGDKYYNTTTKKIYVATATDTWSAEGETPLEDIFYVLFDDNTTYAWDGEDLISVGGGSGGSDDIVVIGSESDTTENTKLLVDTSGQETTLKHKDENLGTFVDTLSAYVNGKIATALQLESGTFTITKTGGNGNIITNSLEWKRFGKIVQVYFQFNTQGGATAVGSNILTGTVSDDLPLPSNYEAIGFGYYGSTINACIIRKTKDITIRCLASQAVQAPDVHGMSVMYICD